MHTDQVIAIGQGALHLAIVMSLPAVLTAMVVGLLISVVQAATQIQEQTLTTVPKIIAVFMVLVLTGTWALATMTQYATSLFLRIGAGG